MIGFSGFNSLRAGEIASISDTVKKVKLNWCVSKKTLHLKHY